ncbi:TPA: JAB domain-containing protein [Escherichia coli]|uniref:JAB domain-containing protein n=1 Tax=Pseudomonas aeruginosa TaxID=287 RepID=UPI001EDA51FF|nr:JAB domain-containing protein [Enterobacter hormaechei]
MWAACCSLHRITACSQFEPSRADKIFTKRLKEALALVEVRVLDNIIVRATLPRRWPNEACCNQGGFSPPPFFCCVQSGLAVYRPA